MRVFKRKRQHLVWQKTVQMKEIHSDLSEKAAKPVAHTVRL